MWSRNSRTIQNRKSTSIQQYWIFNLNFFLRNWCWKVHRKLHFFNSKKKTLIFRWLGYSCGCICVQGDVQIDIGLTFCDYWFLGWLQCACGWGIYNNKWKIFFLNFFFFYYKMWLQHIMCFGAFWCFSLIVSSMSTISIFVS